MKLTGQQFDQIQTALLDAFTEFELRQLTRVRMDTTLAHVAGGQNLTEIVFNLIAWAEAEGRVSGLIAAAATANPHNQSLQTLQNDVGSWLDEDVDGALRPVRRKLHVEVPPPPEPLRPPSTDPFIGREEELGYYAARLHEQGVVAIAGMVGVGKSALAAVLAARFASADHIFWHSFYQGENIRSMIWKLAAFHAYHGQTQLWEVLNSRDV